MSYLVFARKFRPQDFNEVVGQEPIITTLKNAIRQGRIPQNFLFAGPRGVGKTSTARILAKSLNCIKGPAENPCGKCPACIEITAGNSMDVLEIDGASNRGIDEIRNLRETVKFKPVTGRMKIYIIDEVHMLTTEAFNALLKTLEEPPEHVKFVFATTESHKVPLTILSRCHRFNFKRIPVLEIATKLEEIAKAEKISFDKKALFQIAKASEGALRDAEGLLDQLASFADGKIKEDDVLLMLGLASEEVYFSVLGALLRKDAAQVFNLVRDLYDQGKDLIQFAKGLLEIFRHLLLIQCTEKADEFIEMSEDAVKELKSRKNDFSRGELLLALSLLGNLQGQLRRNLAPPRLLVETALLKLLHVDHLKSIDQISPAQAYAPPALPAAAPVYRTPSPASEPSARPVPPAAASPQRQQQEPPPARSSVPRAQASGSGVSGLNGVQSHWPRVIEYVKTKRMSTGIFLSESEPVECAETLVTLGLPVEFQFHREMLEKGTNRQLIEEAFEVVSGTKYRIQFAITKAEKRESAAVPAPEEESQDAAKVPDIINQALNIFEGSKIIRKE